MNGWNPGQTDCSWTYVGSQPHHTSQVRGGEHPGPDGTPVRREPFVNVPQALNEAVLFQLLVVLVQELLWVFGAAMTALLATSLQNVQARARSSHRCSVWTLLTKQEQHSDSKCLRQSFVTWPRLLIFMRSYGACVRDRKNQSHISKHSI